MLNTSTSTLQNLVLLMEKAHDGNTSGSTRQREEFKANLLDNCAIFVQKHVSYSLTRCNSI